MYRTLMPRTSRSYPSKDAVRSAGRAPSTLQVKSFVQKVFTALEPCIRDGRITVQDYCYFREHMKERHSDYNVGLRLFISLPNKYYIKKPIQFNLSFPVPYLSRYGLVNFEYLRNLASTGFNPDILKPLLPFSFEIRGFPEARGVYISVTHLDVIAERLGLRIEDDYDAEAADTSLDQYTYQEWYLLAPNPMSTIFPANHTTNQVVHDPETLFAITDKVLPHSCGGSVEASSNDVPPFRRSNLPQPSFLLETKEKRRAEETDAWIAEQEEVRRARRRGKGNRADITPTKFGVAGFGGGGGA
ncbi:hypothetical protein C8A01DRAFT_34283 [Parachaetomium inaequale]|uniref:Uncharacterized protein n=1 Tax=Parachaetomium inaequale TaxID=2588326 RepID=A0AAN6PND7_9PEZI|nr:hypothetical protein C8A01DRAFT_34283 [Parachaetomium inaequale]